MASKGKSPTTSSTAFDCPHCGVFTTQQWFKLHADDLGEDLRTPRFPDADTKTRLLEMDNVDDEERAKWIAWVDRIQTGLAFVERNKQGSYIHYAVHNLHISKCFDCKEVSVWVHERLVFPYERAGDLPNSDLPPEIAHDFEEARSILNDSPRGAAALLRLSVQKLCAFLGEEGKNIDSDIASLVGKGLNPLIQKSLDVVRVIGNEAVHPGVIDLRDDRDTALQLLKIVNHYC